MRNKVACDSSEKFNKCTKKVDALDVDSAGVLANKKDWKIKDDSDQFFKCYSLKSILDYMKMDEFLLQCILWCFVESKELISSWQTF